jgi:hypothetical protein
MVRLHNKDLLLSISALVTEAMILLGHVAILVTIGNIIPVHVWQIAVSLRYTYRKSNNLLI